MDEVREFCKRVLGDGPEAEEVWRSLLSEGGGRIARLTAAANACRARSGTDFAGREEPRTADFNGLAFAVAQELALATARLPERQREALALRELLRLSYEQLALVMGIEATAVPMLLARARLRLRAERRATPADPRANCAERERALRGLVRRQDSEPLTAGDDAWLMTHLGECEECNRSHAAMLEASACYRAWPARRRSAGRSGPGSPSDAVGAGATA